MKTFKTESHPSKHIMIRAWLTAFVFTASSLMAGAAPALTARAEDTPLSITQTVGSGGFTQTSPGDSINITQSGTYTITGTGNTNDIVTVTGNITADITLQNVNLNADYESPFYITGGATANLTLAGDNTLTVNKQGTALEVDEGNTVSISGAGTLNAHAYEENGIGSGLEKSAIWPSIAQYYKCGTINIKGGTVNAYGDGGIENNVFCGAGIGGMGGTVNITGGNVNAYGGSNNLPDKGKNDLLYYECAAGIGGDSGYEYTFIDHNNNLIYTPYNCEVNISGGTVNAIGGRGGAGIGSSYYIASGKINISGGTVIAKGGMCAAGIGGGIGGDCGDVNITGGNVTATAGDSFTFTDSYYPDEHDPYYPSGIGGGGIGMISYKGAMGAVKISGAGTVVSATSVDGNDIGSTVDSNSNASKGSLTVGSQTDCPSQLPELTLGKNGTNSPTSFVNCKIDGAGADKQQISGTYCSINYQTNGGAITGDAPTYYIQGQAKQIPTPTRQYYIFDGWYTNPQFTGSGFTSIGTDLTGAVTLNAKWKGNPHVLNFDAQGGTTESDQNVNYGAPVGTLPSPTRDKYDFSGWFSDKNGQGVQYNQDTPFMTDNDVTLYAKWTGKPHTLHFDTQEDTQTQGSTPVSDQTVNYNAAVGTLPSPTRSGYSLVGWFTGKNGQGTQYKPDTIFSLTGDVTLYAYWQVVSSGGRSSTPLPTTVTGTATTDKNGNALTAATITADNTNTGTVSTVTVNLGNVAVQAPSSVLSAALGSGTSLTLSQSASPTATQTSAFAITTAAGVKPLASLDFNLSSIAPDGTATAVHSLSGSVTATITLTAEQKAAIGSAVPDVYYYDTSTTPAALVDMHAVYDAAAGTLTFTTNHFSTYVLTTPAAPAVYTPGLSYAAHVQNIGWQKAVNDGDTAGTQGRALRVEALQISLTGTLPAGASVIYQAHVQNIGWQKAVSDGASAGTEGKSLRVEALRITLKNLPGYSVKYRTFVQNRGWLDWCKTANGTDIKDATAAGTEGKALRVEAVEIELVKN